MGRWVEQYRAGQHRQAWIDMTSLGPDLRSDEAALSAATTVAHETMRRARHNVERLVERLPEFGFEFESEPVTDPPPDARTQLDTLEGEIGILPLSLRTWFEEVGQVNLNGVHPEWAFEYPDPLVVDAPVEYIRSEYEAWLADRGTEWDHGSLFEVPVAPDYHHKAKVSGGVPYGLDHMALMSGS